MPWWPGSLIPDKIRFWGIFLGTALCAAQEGLGLVSSVGVQVALRALGTGPSAFILGQAGLGVPRSAQCVLCSCSPPTPESISQHGTAGMQAWVRLN